MAVKYSFKVKLTSVGGGFLFVCFCEKCVFVLVGFFVCFLGKHTWKCSLWVRELCQRYSRSFCFI